MKKKENETKTTKIQKPANSLAIGAEIAYFSLY